MTSMLNKSQIAFVKSLHDKSGRAESGCFLVEGEKNILEFLASHFVARELFLTESFADEHQEILKGKRVLIATEKEIEKMSALESNKVGMAIFFKSYKP
jgi:tRNA G18 (ribose-2'-O)-methylase SpoU